MTQTRSSISIGQTIRRSIHRLGNYLSDSKDELGANDHIVKFCSEGPRNYGY